MTGNKNNEQAIGIAFAALAYFLWGVLPFYWKLLQSISSKEVLAHRIIWAALFLIILLIITGQFKNLLSEGQTLLHEPFGMLCIFLASIMISIQWYTYIWAVGNGQIVQASLGYYINPLVSVLLGMLFLREKLSFWQMFASLIALLGVISLTIQYGVFPWISITLALSFGIYGLLKKFIAMGAITGLTIETLITSVVAAIYLFHIYKAGEYAFRLSVSPITLLLIGSGAVTAIPLILFTAGTKRLQLFVVGFLQYICPTLSLFIAIFIYHEHFTIGNLLSFAVIWVALLVFSLARTPLFIGLERRLLNSAKL